MQLLDQAVDFEAFKNRLSRCAQPESRCAHRPAITRPTTDSSGGRKPLKAGAGRCAHRDSGCAHRENISQVLWNSPPDLSRSHPGVNPLPSATKLLLRVACTHTHDFTFKLSISTFSANVRSDPTTAAALSCSKRLALAAVGRGGTSRATSDHERGSQ